MRRLDLTPGPAAIALLALLATIAATLLLVDALDIVPPDELSFAAGRQGGAYHGLAERYRDILAEDGIEVEILETAGSVENAARLAAGEADVALLQGGVAPPPGEPVEALAAAFLEGFFLFHRLDAPEAADPIRWAGLRLAAGEPESGARAALTAVAEALGLDPAEAELVSLGGRAAAEALIAGEVDAAVFVAPVDAPYLAPLFESEAAVFSTLRDVEALARRLTFVRLADIPPAGLDYAGRLPPERVVLPAMVAALVARESLHPALVDRLVRAAEIIHAAPNLLHGRTRFPSTAGLDLPMNGQAAKRLERGPGPLDLALPFWMSAQIERFALLLLPILVLLLPLIRALPGLYAWSMRSRVYRRYAELAEIEKEAEADLAPARRAALIDRLDAIDAEARRLRVPLAYREGAYALRLHADLVRRRLRDGRLRPPETPPG